MSRPVGVVAAICLWMSACGSPDRDSTWFVDGAFSEALTGRAQQVEVAIGRNPLESVEIVQAFSTSINESDVIDVDRIRSQELVYETRDRDTIRAFFLAAQETLRGDGCDPYQSRMVLHVLAFDPSLHRVGYFRYYPCPGDAIGAIAPIGSRSVYFSRKLAAFLIRGE